MGRRLCAMVLAAWAGWAQAAETITFACDEWVGYSQSNGQGYYLALMRAIFPAPEYQIKHEIVPYERAMHRIEVQSADVSAGAYVGAVADALYSEAVTDLDVIDAAVRKDSFHDWQGIASLKNKTVVAKIGYGFNEYTDVPLQYSEKPNLRAMLQMLLASRVDAVLDYKKEIDKVLPDLPQADALAIKLNVLKGDLHFIFANTPKGQRLKVRFDQEFARLKARGEVKRLLMATVKEDRFYAP